MTAFPAGTTPDEPSADESVIPLVNVFSPEVALTDQTESKGFVIAMACSVTRAGQALRRVIGDLGLME